jgi:hypothetical protein
MPHRLSPPLKKKTVEIASGRSVSISQLLEELMVFDVREQKKALRLEVVRVLIREELHKALARG